MLTWGAGTWGLFAGFLAVLVAGIALGAYGLARPGAGPGTAHDILAERLARGEISPEEYEQRLAVLGPGGGGISSAAKPLAVALVAAGLIGSLVVAAVGPGSGGGFMRTMMNGGMGQMMGGGQPGRAASPPVQGAQEIRVTAREFSFSPDELHIKEGAMVNVVVDNQGTLFHTLTIADAGFELRANGGQSISGSLRIDRPGRYPFICAVPGHAQAGMRGTVVVT